MLPSNLTTFGNNLLTRSTLSDCTCAFAHVQSHVLKLRTKVPSLNEVLPYSVFVPNMAF